MTLQKSLLDFSRLALILGLFGFPSNAMGICPAPASKPPYEVFAEGLARADNIVVAPDGSLYVSLELAEDDGMVVRLENGRRSTIAQGLRRPDGLALTPSHLFVTEEVPNGRVIRIDLKDLSRHVVARLQKPEGIIPLADGSLIVAEDLRTRGRVLRVSVDGSITVLADDLRKSEGLARGPGGDIYVAESYAGRILRVTERGVETLVAGLDRPDQIAVAADGSLWITEDRVDGRLLRYRSGHLETVIDGLQKPQGLAFDGSGWLYVAEQGRDRIIRVRTRPDQRLYPVSPPTL